MKICICDKDLFIRKKLQQFIKAFEIAENVFEFCFFSNGEDMLKSINNSVKFDIVFLDIDLKDVNGITIAERIKETAPKTIIIFLSGVSDYIFEAFRLEVLHFLVKPIKENEFKEVFNRALKKYTSLNSTLILKWKNERYCISIDEISFVEGYNRHLCVHTASGNYEAVGKIVDLYEILKNHNFVRIHQGFVVNMQYIKNFKTEDVELTDGTKVMVSVRKKQEALKIYDEYIKKSMYLLHF